MYTPAPSQRELEATGLTAEDFERDVIEVWPENQRAYFLFAELQTQWRAGAAGPTGLDYNVLFTKLDRMKLADEEAEQLEGDIRVMEHEALKTMSERE
jgi:hypothetical protein